MSTYIHMHTYIVFAVTTCVLSRAAHQLHNGRPLLVHFSPLGCTSKADRLDQFIFHVRVQFIMPHRVLVFNTLIHMHIYIVYRKFLIINLLLYSLVSAASHRAPYPLHFEILRRKQQTVKHSHILINLSTYTQIALPKTIKTQCLVLLSLKFLETAKKVTTHSFPAHSRYTI